MSRLPTKWEILSIVALNLLTPFFYLFDIVKDCIQLSLLLSIVGGLWLFLENWLSFTSVVSYKTYSNFEIVLTLLSNF